MDVGAQLPLIDVGDGPPTAADLASYARCCVDLGYAALAANDHLVFPLPWVDGLAALAAVAAVSGDLTLATTVALPVVRGPVQLAKTLASIDVLSDGRLLAGVGPGSSPRDHAAAGVDFEDRWRRLDDAIRVMQALWQGEQDAGPFYTTGGIELSPRPVQPGGPPLWVGSWGSPAGLRRVARLADGWLASAYHLTPETFTEASGRLHHELVAAGRPAHDFPNAVATFFFQVTDDRAEACRLVSDVLAPMLNRSPEILADRLAVGPAELLTGRLADLRDAGVQRVYLWPLRDHLDQLQLAREAWPA